MSTTELCFAGVIAAESDPPGIEASRWEALIASHPALTPLGGEPRGARILLDGDGLGILRWSTSGANELDVHGDVATLARIAAEIALALDARFVTLAELTSC